MSDNWVTKAVGKTQPVQDYAGVGKELTILLILGRNIFGDDIYTYLKLPYAQIENVKKQLDSGQNFTPSHYGTVLAAGRGKPNPDITEEVGLPEFIIHAQPKPGIGKPPQKPGGYQ